MSNQQYVSYDATGRPYLHLAVPALRFEDFCRHQNQIDHDQKNLKRVIIIDLTADDSQTYEF